MNDAIEWLREALVAERRTPPRSCGVARKITDAALDELAAAITPPVQVEAPVDRRDEPVTLGVLNAIVTTAWARASREGSGRSLALAYLLDVIREEFQ